MYSWYINQLVRTSFTTCTICIPEMSPALQIITIGLMFLDSQSFLKIVMLEKRKL